MVTDNCSLVTVKKPHWRRTQQVYEVLNQAPQEATYDRLIEYVRIQTGKGCSRKLISKWKKTVIRSVNGDPLFVTSKSTNKSKSTKNHQDEPFESHTNVIAVAISCDHNPVDLTPTQIIPAINQTEPEPIQKVKLVESQANSTTIDHQNNKDEDKPKIAHQTLLLTKNELTDDCPLTTQSDVTDNLQVQSCTKRSPEVRFQREQTNNSKNDSSLITNNCSPITDDYLPPVSEKETTANCSLATDNCKSNWSLKKSLFTATAIFVGIVGCSWFFSKDNSKPVIAQPTAVESIQNSELNSQNTSLDSKTAPIQNREVQNQEVQNRRVQNRRVQNGIPRTFKISLTVTSPQDLKVKPGDEITLGQVLSARRRRTFGERTTERQRLLAQKKQLEISLKKLDLPIPELTQPKPIPALSKLPPVSYQQEEANIALKQQELAEAERAIANQEIKIKELESIQNQAQKHSKPLSTMNDNVLNADDQSQVIENESLVNGNRSLLAVIEHEKVVLEQLKAARDKAKLQLDIAKSKLITAKEQRAHIEYQRYLEETKRAIALQQQQIELERQRSIRAGQLQEREYSKAQIETKIQEIDNAIAQLSTVKAPYAGKLKKVKWTGQDNHNLTVQLTLDVDNTSEKPTITSKQ